MNDAYFDDAVTAALAARDQRRAERLEILLCDEFRKEVSELEAENLHTLKSWRIAQAAGLTAHQLEFADIEAERTASRKGMTDLARERRDEIRGDGKLT